LPDSTPIKSVLRKNPSGNVVEIMNTLEDTIQSNDTISEFTMQALDDKYNDPRRKAQVITSALRQARNFKVNINSQRVRLQNLNDETNKYSVEKYKKYSQAFACIVMFLIGAPLGAIIKKGGLGVPFIISILFFIIYYVLTIISEKWAKAGLVDPQLAVWTADLLLLPVGLFFLRQARIDARLFDTDFYLVIADRINQSILKKRKK
jgi:lipopolysaccharide export system permease protein